MNKILWFIDQGVGQLLRQQNTRYKSPWLVVQHEQICCMTSCEFRWKMRNLKPKFVGQIRPLLYFLQQLSSTHIRNICFGTNWSCNVKNVRHWPKTLQQNNVARQVEGFCILYMYFAAFKGSPLVSKFSCSRLFHFVSLLDYTDSCSC